MQQLELLKLTVRKVGLPPLIEWHSNHAAGKPTFPTLRFLSLNAHFGSLQLLRLTRTRLRVVNDDRSSNWSAPSPVECDTPSQIFFLPRFVPQSNSPAASACRKLSLSVSQIFPDCGDNPNTTPSAALTPGRRSASGPPVRGRWNSRRPCSHECCD